MRWEPFEIWCLAFDVLEKALDTAEASQGQNLSHVRLGLLETELAQV